MHPTAVPEYKCLWNSRCLKPHFLISGVFDPREKLPVKRTLKVKIYLADGWRMDFNPTRFDIYSPPDFYTRVGIAAAPRDSIIKKTKAPRDSYSWIATTQKQGYEQLSLQCYEQYQLTFPPSAHSTTSATTYHCSAIFITYNTTTTSSNLYHQTIAHNCIHNSVAHLLSSLYRLLQNPLLKSSPAKPLHYNYYTNLLNHLPIAYSSTTSQHCHHHPTSHNLHNLNCSNLNKQHPTAVQTSSITSSRPTTSQPKSSEPQITATSPNPQTH